MIILAPYPSPTKLLAQDPGRNRHQKRKNLLDSFLFILSRHFLFPFFPFCLNVIIDLFGNLCLHLFLRITDRLFPDCFDLFKRVLVCSPVGSLPFLAPSLCPCHHHHRRPFLSTKVTFPRTRT